VGSDDDGLKYDDEESEGSSDGSGGDDVE